VIVVDTSALMALLLSEPSADRIAEILASEDQIVLSAGTLAEALIVAARRGVYAATPAMGARPPSCSDI
jgi:ribonuclease VapC